MIRDATYEGGLKISAHLLGLTGVPAGSSVRTGAVVRFHGDPLGDMRRPRVPVALGAGSHGFPHKP